MKKRTAVLIFRREASEEIRRKRFWDRSPVISYLYKRTLRVAEATGFEVIDHIDSGSAHPAQIQQRLTSTIARAFETGMSRVLVIGTDCATLSTEDLLQASQSLQHHPTVLGPDQRGGAYLMGFNKAAFERHLFAKLPWGSARFAEDFLRCFPKSVCQTQQFDLNSPKELQRLAKSTLRKKLLKPLIALIGTHWELPFPVMKMADNIAYFHKPLRAPPMGQR
ncbi:DUF2064 domain-containing protein [Marinoscillum furvescens]|uniref:Uncharacterized protein DUF2064 n=1 Tax=Marinoscillum furvescens DSM 4134 TaxID=1122208 RepID=A0A3D9KWM4_MARFU|nr:DUF2064 domain-containing protein [Marinoscillum furvescens]RED92790.1 uncharacterized protein DUF2064 [Marinoscillum furvescens DSM 4134]